MNSDAPRPGDTTGPSDTRETVRVRRAPKYAVFVVLGVGLGILTAMVLTLAFDGTAEKSPNTGLVYTTTQVFGFLLLVCIPATVAFTTVCALILDRMLARRSRDVVASHERVRPDEDASGSGRS